MKRSWLETLESLAASLLGMEGVFPCIFIGWEWRTLKKAVIAKPKGRKHLSKFQFSNPPWLHMDHNSSRYESQKELDRAQWPVPNWLLLVVHPWQSGWSWSFTISSEVVNGPIHESHFSLTPTTIPRWMWRVFGINKVGWQLDYVD